MGKAVIVYGSTTGNTESVARRIGDILTRAGHEVLVQDVRAVQVDQLGQGCDITLLGSSTWGEDEIEFQEDFAPFFDAMDRAELGGRKVALFGCGDSSYPHFCGAVDQLEEKVQALGAVVVGTPLRIDGDPVDASAEIDEWADEVAAAL
ncbi:MAG: flavodoxin [Desulfobulbus sp.]|jgi:flavodoxin I